MNFALIVIAMSILAGCSRDRFPSAPSAAAATALAFLSGKIVDQHGVCIPGATVHVVRGQLAGKSFTQSAPCDVWSYEPGFNLSGLTPGATLTLQVTALGYAPEEKDIVPTLGPQEFVIFRLAQIQSSNAAALPH